MNKNQLEPLIHLQKGFKVLDQKKLPTAFEYITVNNAKDTFQVIREMNVRGAPFIAVVALYGLVLEVENNLQNIKTTVQFKEYVKEQIEYLKQSRPTAVNLFNDTDFILRFVQDLDEQLSIDKCFEQLKFQVEKIDKDYVQASDDMAQYGYQKVIQDVPKIMHDKINVLTICNTGKLAVPGVGTALGLIREIHKRGKLNMVYVPETRPYLQGFRLTASEVLADEMPGTLITDSMAGFLMKQGKIDLVVIGADRVASNGDTANKIGSYSFSVLAKNHGIPFYTVLPESTIDRQCPNGSYIEIEQRPGNEMIYLNNQQIAPLGLNTYNPAFDVTPSSNITRVITEKGEFQFDREIQDWEQVNHESLSRHLKNTVKYFEENEELEIQEVGDGNLNLVFIVKSKKNSQKQVICKQALPYIRCVGPEWPFPLNRAYFESQALSYQFQQSPEHTPKMIHHDKKLQIITMEFLEPPYIILRKGLINQNIYENAAKHIATFTAKTLFFSSGLHLDQYKLREKIAFWCQNTSLCGLTEQVIFLDPYYDAQYNKHSPQIDDLAKQIKQDVVLINAVMKLRNKFISEKQALIHGDLHTGSVMVTEKNTKIIDPEFAFYGPMGFDLGALVANYFLNYFSQSSKQENLEKTKKFQTYLLDQVKQYWETFEAEFTKLWQNEENYKNSCFYPSILMQKSEQFAQNVRETFIKQLWEDMLGFVGCKIIRRILGIAHVEDMEGIQDENLKAKCERSALQFAREILVNTQKYQNIQQLQELAINNLP
ncbi:Protein kinase-like domain [Pseudocohnilembus persalinus]|uniref:S-methyl-5-thioribose kinase n=1 Tax=Pseudocohnilembus persalinus TaxID=266149 RepID=A0A0V0R9K3_PSEPJ|nr:Protein kinase-like domain [Pseudocohnilembus persalinus]|eukprot:KRX11150.1 Protein kinase-like domain [Pseudocohnilembus persalinus]